MRTDYRSVYVAFDPHPSYKGASTHIHRMVEVLARDHSPLLLLTLASNLDVINSPAVHHLRFESIETNLLKRAMAFMSWVRSILGSQHQLMIGHYRDCWGGMAFSEFPHIHTVFEVNGLASIELPYRYTSLGERTLRKIMKIENNCLQKASAVITPSHTTAKCLVQRGVESSKITVIPNGADIPSFGPPVPDLPSHYMVYFGALQRWQGVDMLFKSFRYLPDVNLPLVICSSYSEHLAKAYMKFAQKLGIEHRVIWRFQLAKPDLDAIVQHALFSVAPLTECSRNVEQGCSPLKILESMACGTPVIASALPPVQEIITHNQNGILCRPDRPADLARAIRLAVDYPDHTAALGQHAREHVENDFTWAKAQKKLQRVYNSILTFSF